QSINNRYSYNRNQSNYNNKNTYNIYNNNRRNQYYKKKDNYNTNIINNSNKNPKNRFNKKQKRDEKEDIKESHYFNTLNNHLINDARIIIDTNIGKLRALLDTGANINICSPAVFYNPLLKDTRQTRRKPFRVEGINNTTTRLNQFITLK